MPDPLSPETLARMKAEHTKLDWDDGCSVCVERGGYSEKFGDEHVKFPCDAALLLAELELRELLIGQTVQRMLEQRGIAAGPPFTPRRGESDDPLHRTLSVREDSHE